MLFARPAALLNPVQRRRIVRPKHLPRSVPSVGPLDWFGLPARSPHWPSTPCPVFVPLLGGPALRAGSSLPLPAHTRGTAAPQSPPFPQKSAEISPTRHPEPAAGLWPPGRRPRLSPSSPQITRPRARTPRRRPIHGVALQPPGTGHSAHASTRGRPAGAPAIDPHPGASAARPSVALHARQHRRPRPRRPLGTSAAKVNRTARTPSAAHPAHA